MINFSQWLANNMLSVLQTISIAIASGTAIYGIVSWRVETIGKKKLDLSEKTLALFYEAKDNIRFIRNPTGFVDEGFTRKKGPDETEEETKRLNQAYVLIERYNKVSTKFNELFSLKYHFMAVFGKENCKYFDDLGRILNKIFIANRMLYNYYYNPETRRTASASQEDLQRFLEEFEEHEKIIWDYGDNDKINQSIDNIISNVEKVCKSFLKIK